MRHLVIPLLVLPILLACSKPPPAEEPVRAVRTLTLQMGTSSLQHEYAAEVRARTESRLGFRVAGKLVRRLVNVGDPVKLGQVLAQIDASDFKLGQDVARAAASNADAQLALSSSATRICAIRALSVVWSWSAEKPGWRRRGRRPSRPERRPACRTTRRAMPCWWLMLPAW